MPSNITYLYKISLGGIRAWNRDFNDRLFIIIKHIPGEIGHGAESLSAARQGVLERQNTLIYKMRGIVLVHNNVILRLPQTNQVYC